MLAHTQNHSLMSFFCRAFVALVWCSHYCLSSQVYARVRPFTKAEIANGEQTLLRPGKNEWTLELNETEKDVMGKITDKWREFAFDHVFQFGLEGSKGNATQQHIYEETKQFADLSMSGINCCVFAYGQSGTGKVSSMLEVFALNLCAALLAQHC